MNFHFLTKYDDQTDKQIIEKILSTPHNEEAAFYLLHNRYYNLLYNVYTLVLQKMFIKSTRGLDWLDDCINELFLHLKGKDGSWHPLATFEWRCTFGSWLKGVANHKFAEVIPRMIENYGENISLENDDSNVPKVQIPDGGEEDYERRQRKVILIEAIGLLKDDEQRFVVLKRLEGYNSKEIAVLLQKKWQKQGIKKYNNNGELVVPNAAYVNVHTQRAKDNLRKIIKVIN